MSGGVDSSVSALLLKNKGYEVIGVTFNLTPDYTGVDDFIKDAKNIALKLGIEHHVIESSMFPAAFGPEGTSCWTPL